MQRPFIYNNDKIYISCMNFIIGQIFYLEIRPIKSVKYSQSPCVSRLDHYKITSFIIKVMLQICIRYRFP